MDEAALVEAWRGGDAGAGEQLVGAHLESVHRFFSNKVRGAADDLVQKTFLACAESLPSYEGRASFRAYLFGIARHMLYRHYRESDREFDPLTRSAGAALVDEASPADRVATREEQKLLLRGLRELPLELQTLVELAYWEGLSDRELADVVEVAPGTIKSRLRKARQLLEEELTRLAPSPELLAETQQSLRQWAAGIRAKTGIAGGQGRR